jgi:hypothetical protein
MFRLLTGAQLRRLHHPDSDSPTHTTAARKARAHLGRLVTLGVVFRLPRRIGGVEFGADGFIYGLTGLGQAVLDLDTGKGVRQPRGAPLTKPAFADHLLGCVELYVQLTEFCRSTITSESGPSALSLEPLTILAGSKEIPGAQPKILFRDTVVREKGADEPGRASEPAQIIGGSAGRASGTAEPAVEILDYQPEPHCWRWQVGAGGEPVALKPDGWVHLGIGDYERTVFLEHDLATESLPTITRKLQRYVAYWRSGQEQHEQGIFPQVWWLVPHAKRREAIAATIRRLPPDTHHLFVVCLASDAVPLLTQLPNEGGEL